ncbi:hypothetical protein MUP77_10340 [Candidatus Bathyarchaeota archaeon]|nr:hypothetical protein [Candidatus Bathyarchaeota archaeon]
MTDSPKKQKGARSDNWTLGPQSSSEKTSIVERFFAIIRTYYVALALASPLVTAVVTLVITLVFKEISASEGIIIGISLTILEQVLLLVAAREHVMPSLSRITNSLKEIDEKHILLQHERIALSDPVLRQRYSEVVNQFFRHVIELGDGYFEMEIDDINRISIDVVESLKAMAFATVVVGETDQIFLRYRTRQQFLEACYRAAKHIKEFKRLFIIRHLADVTWDRYRLMEEHNRNGIQVLVAFREDLIHEGLDPTDDFGLWDDRYLMRLRSAGVDSPLTMTVHVAVTPGRSQVINQARRKAERLKDIAYPWDQFNELLCQPMNAQGWSSLIPTRVYLDPPAGPSDKDVETMWHLASVDSRDIRRVLVLGQTRRLIHNLASKQLEVDVLDIMPLAPADLPKGVRNLQGNWLTWSAPQCHYYDAIFGDDVLNNLAIWQHALFFANMSRLLKPTGILVMRSSHSAMTQQMNLPTFNDVLEYLKTLDKAHVDECMILARCWPMFHNAEFYDDETQSFRLNDWNERLRQAEQSAREYSHFRLEMNLSQTSSPMSEIRVRAEPWFAFGERRKVDSAYASLAPNFEAFYSIFSFVSKSMKSNGDTNR